MTKRIEDIYTSYDLEEFLMDMLAEVQEFADIDEESVYALIQQCHKHND